MEKGKEEKIKELVKKFGIDLKKLEEEQKKLSKTLSIKDSIDFSLVETACGIENIFIKNKIISAVVVIDKNFEILEKRYFTDRVKFPYISGFRAYRELPAMLSVFELLEEKPDLIFIHGNGILHLRNFGIASHFSLSAGIPSIGITDSSTLGEIKGEDIILNNKIAGKIMQSKEGSKPLYISPGNLISIKTALELTKKFTKEPNKFPEPLRLAKKYVREVMKEVFVSS